MTCPGFRELLAFFIQFIYNFLLSTTAIFFFESSTSFKTLVILLLYKIITSIGGTHSYLFE